LSKDKKKNKNSQKYLGGSRIPGPRPGPGADRPLAGIDLGHLQVGRQAQGLRDAGGAGTADVLAGHHLDGGGGLGQLLKTLLPEPLVGVFGAALGLDLASPATGIKVFSLYGATDRPTPAMLQGIDALVFDVQDMGVHFYTYESTMAYAMEAAAKAGIAYYVLDRPNPITGTRIEGPMLDAANRSNVGYMAGEPVRHGMTMGELAKMFNAENKIGASLTVVPMQDWQRGDWFDATNLVWINPSPNMRSLNAAMLYPGIALLEYSKNLSVGRGTDAPFEQTGADFIGGRDGNP